jgi:sec-independent protein translocase protein TatB
MFDIGFLEMMVIGVLALIVLGPERLPGAIKSCVQTVRSIKDMANGFKQEVSAQIDAHELHANLKEAEKLGMQNLGKELKESVEELKSAAESVQRPYKKDPQALAEKLTPQIGDDDDSQAVSSLTGLPIAQDRKRSG